MTVASGARTPPTGPRDIPIDALRGMAIILMVAGHVIGSGAEAGMRVADDSGWRYSYLLLSDLRMPLFTALSGFVYALRPLTGGSSYPRFARGKARRLLVPLITVGTLFVLLQGLTPGTNAGTDVADAWRLYVFGTGHFWFLQAIFLIFLLVGLLDAARLLESAGRVAMAAAAAALVSVLVRVPGAWDIFSVNGALRLLPFFLLGYGLCRFWSDRPRLVLLVAAGALLCVRALDVLGVITLPRLSSAVLSITLGLCGIAALLMYRRLLAWKPLAKLGYFSYAIYLLHVFGTAPARMLLHRLGVDSEALVFGVCLIAGLALPVLFEMTLGRIGWISWAFLGQKPYAGRARPHTPGSRAGEAKVANGR